MEEGYNATRDKIAQATLESDIDMDLNCFISDCKDFVDCELDPETEESLLKILDMMEEIYERAMANPKNADSPHCIDNIYGGSKMTICCKTYLDSKEEGYAYINESKYLIYEYVDPKGYSFTTEDLQEIAVRYVRRYCQYRYSGLSDGEIKMVVSYYDERNEYIHTITDKDTLASMISIMEYTVNSDIDELLGYEH